MTEAEWLRLVLDYAGLCGWRCVHFRPARVGKGGRWSWRTAVQADGAGFPDLVLLRGRRGVAAELKGPRGRLSPEQDAWLKAFAAAGFGAYVWRPSDWPDVERVLARTPDRPPAPAA